MVAGPVERSLISGPTFKTVGFVLGPGGSGVLHINLHAEGLRLSAELTLAMVLLTPPTRISVSSGKICASKSRGHTTLHVARVVVEEIGIGLIVGLALNRVINLMLRFEAGGRSRVFGRDTRGDGRARLRGLNSGPIVAGSATVA